MEKKKRSAGKWIAKNKRWAIYFRDGMSCVYCNKNITDDGVKLSLDHIVAWSKMSHNGQPDNRHTNLVTCCMDCNMAKDTLNMDQWLLKLQIREECSDEHIQTVKNRIFTAISGKDSRKRKENTLHTLGYWAKSQEFLSNINQ